MRGAALAVGVGAFILPDHLTGLNIRQVGTPIRDIASSGPAAESLLSWLGREIRITHHSHRGVIVQVVIVRHHHVRLGVRHHRIDRAEPFSADRLKRKGINKEGTKERLVLLHYLSFHMPEVQDLQHSILRQLKRFRNFKEGDQRVFQIFVGIHFIFVLRPAASSLGLLRKGN